MQISGNKGSGSFDNFRKFSGSLRFSSSGSIAPSPSLEVKKYETSNPRNAANTQVNPDGRF